MATKPEVLVARDEMLVALATVLVAISSPAVVKIALRLIVSNKLHVGVTRSPC